MANKTINIDVNVQTASISELEEELKKVNDQLKEIPRNDPEFDRLAQEAKVLKEELDDANKAAEGFTKEDKFLAAEGAIKAVGGAVSGLVGAMGLLGVESEVLGEFEKKAASALAFAVGVRDVAEGFNQLRRSGALANAVIKANNVLNKVTTVTMRALGVAVNTTSTAFRGLRAAIAATGIGLLVVGLGLLIEKLFQTKDAAKDAADSFKDITEANNEFNESLTGSDRLLRIRMEQLKAAGADEKKLKEEEVKFLLNKEEELNEEIERLRKERIQGPPGRIQAYTQEEIDAYYKILDDQIKALEDKAEEVNESFLIAFYQGQQILNKETEDFFNGLESFLDEYDDSVADTLEEQELNELRAAEKKYTILLEKYDEYAEVAGEQFKEFGISREQIEEAQEKNITEIKDRYAKIRQGIADAEYQEEINKRVEAFRRQFDIDDFYRTQDLIQQEEYVNKLNALQEFALTSITLTSPKRMQQMLKDMGTSQITILDEIQEAQRIALNNDQLARLAIIQDARNQELITETEFLNQKAELEKTFAAESTALAEEQANTRMQIANNERVMLASKYQSELTMAADTFTGIGQLLTTLGRDSASLAIAGLIVEKAQSIAGIVANTALANAKLVAAFPVTLGQPWVGINTASAIASIASTVFETGRGINAIRAQFSDAGGGSAGGTATLPTPAQAPATQNIEERAPQQITATPTTRTYVLTGDVTSGIEAEAKLNTKRTIV